MYTDTKFIIASFSSTQVTRSDISFAKGNQYAILWLKQSKTDTKYIGVQIIFVATGEKTCLIAVLIQLYTLDSQPTNAPLFRLSFGAFSQFNMMLILKKQIALAGLA